MKPSKIHWPLIITLVVIKLTIHFTTNTNYGLHRDAYLYLAESEHLAWGYMEVPPMIAVIGKTARLLLGDSVFAVRFFPALIGAITIVLLIVMVQELGGKFWAQVIAGMTFLMSPAFLGSNTLFQPVSFNQFFWFLAAFFTVKILKYERAKYWYLLGITAGIGFLTKYSIAFFFLALMIGFLITPKRKVFLTPQPWIAMGIALLIALPNLIWQYQLNFPVVRHMTDLAQTQLVNVSTAGFLIPQFLFHFAGALVWLGGLYYLFTQKDLKPYRILGWTYFIVVGLLLALSGKDYYTIGAYTMLFAFGGLAWEQWLGNQSWILVVAIVLLNLIVIPYGLPVLSAKKMIAYSAFMKDRFGLVAPLVWEDGTVRPLTQDYADMHGWEEIPPKVARLYHSLTKEEQARCLIIAGHYGQAGVLNLHRKKYQLPETYSFNSSFVSWLPEDIDFDRMIQVDDNQQTSSSFFENVELIDSIENPYARDPGLIYYKSGPKVDVQAAWRDLVREAKREAGYALE